MDELMLVFENNNRCVTLLLFLTNPYVGGEHLRRKTLGHERRHSHTAFHVALGI